jgi:hypothetical protein
MIQMASDLDPLGDGKSSGKIRFVSNQLGEIRLVESKMPDLEPFGDCLQFQGDLGVRPPASSRYGG